MSISVVQTLAKTESASSTALQSAAFGSPVTNGNTIIVYCTAYHTVTTYSCTDTAGNTYTQRALEVNGSSHCMIFEASNVTGGAGLKITVSATNASLITFAAQEVSGLATSSPADGSGSTNNGTSTGPNPGAFSTTNANDLIAIVYMDTGGGTRTITTPSGFTVVDTETSGSTFLVCQFAYEIVSSTQSGINPTWTLNASESWVSCAFAYKSAPPPATSYTTGLSASFGTNGDPVTVTFTPNGAVTGTITPNTDSTGVFSPTSLTWSGTNDAKTCTYTPSVVGVHHIDSTNNAGLTDTSGAQTYHSTTEGVLSITSPPKYASYQQTGSAFNITISGTYTHSPTGDGVVQASLDGTTWTDLVTASAGTFSGTYSVAGTVATERTLSVRWKTDTISTASVPNQRFGDIFMWGGDSNSSGRGLNNQVYTGSGSSVYTGAEAWKDGVDEVNSTQTGFPTGVEGNVLPLITSELNAYNNANGRSGRCTSHFTTGLSSQDFLMQGFGSSGSWSQGAATYNAAIEQIQDASPNGILGIFFSNGPNASLAVSNTPNITPAIYKAALENMTNGFKSDLAAYGANIGTVSLSMGKMDETSFVTTRYTKNCARSGTQLGWNDGPPNYPGPCLYDLALTDGVHWTQNSELAIVAGRYAVAILNAFYGASYGRAPVMRSVTLDATNTVVTIKFNKTLAATGGGYTTGAFRVIDNKLSGTITNATNATPIVFTSANHGLNTGATIVVTGVGGNTNANNTWEVTKIDANTFSAINSSGNAAYTSGGTWTGGNTVAVSSAVQSSGNVVLTLAAPTSSMVNTQVSLGSGNDAIGATVPTAPSITLPSGTVVNQPVEPFFDVVPTAPSSGLLTNRRKVFLEF